MSGAVRAATVVDTIVDTGCETDFPVLSEVPFARVPRVGPPRAVMVSLAVPPDTPAPAAATTSQIALARLFLSGSSGSVDAGVC